MKAKYFGYVFFSKFYENIICLLCISVFKITTLHTTSDIETVCVCVNCVCVITQAINNPFWYLNQSVKYLVNKQKIVNLPISILSFNLHTYLKLIENT